MTSPESPCPVLAYGDTPTCPTGFGTVMRHLLGGLASSGNYDIDTVADSGLLDGSGSRSR